MEKKRMGRPPMDPNKHKKNRAVSLTDTEYEDFTNQALASGCSGPSEYLVRLIGLHRVGLSPRQATAYTIYALLDPRDGVVRYVGCTADLPVRYAAHLRTNENTSSRAKAAYPPKESWINELKSFRLQPDIKILGVKNTIAEANAFEIEMYEKHYNEHMLAKNPSNYQYKNAPFAS